MGKIHPDPYELIGKFHKLNVFCFRYCDRSSPGPVVSPRGTVGLEMFLHTNSHGVFSGFKGRLVVIIISVNSGALSLVQSLQILCSDWLILNMMAPRSMP